MQAPVLEPIQPTPVPQLFSEKKLFVRKKKFAMEPPF